MIQGLIVIEDQQINFRVITPEHGPQRVDVVVVDSPTGREHTAIHDARAFMVALGLALNFDGEFPTTEQAYRLVEPLFEGVDPVFRIIP